mgnify:FL=1|jgi:hypothetical protein|tara:strand:+ start:74 stop:280 length:207 start_codon:yes stop_codon:yes gene_type:complete
MKIGELVKLKPSNTVKMTNPGIDPDSVGLVVQQERASWRQGREFASCWVQWAGRSDWDEMFIQDIKIC